MLKSALLLLLLVFVLLACGIPIPNIETIAGSGNVVSQEANITGFDKVDISNAFKVEIAQGDSFSVIVSVDDNLVEHLNVVKNGTTLNIGLEPMTAFNVRNGTTEATITMPELVGLDLSGASRATITGFKSAESMSIDLSGASSLLGDIEASDVMFDVSGASKVTLSGSAGNLIVDASGASNVDLSDVNAQDANVEASGASRVRVNVNGTLNVDASGASRVNYSGSPNMGSIDTSGGSSVDQQ